MGDNASRAQQKLQKRYGNEILVCHFFAALGRRFLRLLLNPNLRPYHEPLVAVRVLEIEPRQRLKNIRAVAFRPQASSRLSRSGVYVSPVVSLILSN